MGALGAEGIYVYSTAVQDALDLALMRGRTASTLATMVTNMEKLDELADVREGAGTADRMLECAVPDGGAPRLAIDGLGGRGRRGDAVREAPVVEDRTARMWPRRGARGGVLWGDAVRERAASSACGMACTSPRGSDCQGGLRVWRPNMYPLF